MRRKKHIVFHFLVIVLVVAVLIGAGKQPVELLNDNPPLIDLDAAIKEADFGKNGNTGSETGDPSQDQQGEEGDASQGDKNKELKIYVRDEVITYDKLEFRNVNTLRKMLEKDYKEGDVIKLIDDYAEAHRYREVLNMLKEYQSEKGIAFAAD